MTHALVKHRKAERTLRKGNTEKGGAAPVG